MVNDTKNTQQPHLVPSLLKLSAVLGVNRSRFYAVRNRPDAPAPREDGQYDVNEWREYLEALDIEEDDSDHDAEFLRLKREFLKIRTELARFDLMKRQGKLITQNEYMADIREVADLVKWIFDEVPTRVALLTTDKVVIDGVVQLCDYLRAELHKKIVAAEQKTAEAEQTADAAGGSV